MTTLMYLKGPDLPFEELEHDRKFNVAYRLTDDPNRSNEMMRELTTTGGSTAASAHSVLSFRHKWGRTLPVDAAKSLEHLQAAIELGDANAMMTLGDEYAREPASTSSTPTEDDFFPEPPNLVPPDREAALHWYRKAAALDYGPARLKLADFLRRGRYARECTTDEVEEIKTHLLATHKIYEIGSMYCVDKSDPLCSPQDVQEARKWYRQGREDGWESCAKILEEWGEGEREPPAPAWPLRKLLLVPFSIVLAIAVGLSRGIYTLFSRRKKI